MSFISLHNKATGLNDLYSDPNILCIKLNSAPMKLILNVLAGLPFLLVCTSFTSSFTDKPPKNNYHLKNSISNRFKNKTITTGATAFVSWNLEASGLSCEAFEQGVKGYRFFIQRNKLHNNDLLTIIDYSRPSSQKRLYVLDMRSGKILFNTLVAHGHNSGFEQATEFSNDEASHKSSLGFYITMGTYTGANGYSLKLKGCEKGINDNALDRAIVFHGAEYVSESFIRDNGYLGRSYGCPAVPVAIHKKIIDKIKNGSCMFLYHPTKKYMARSKILDS